jgi:hypothetical protein
MRVTRYGIVFLEKIWKLNIGSMGDMEYRKMKSKKFMAPGISLCACV